MKAEVERRAKEDGISINLFVATAVAEKLAAMNTDAFFAERRGRADMAAFDRLMHRKGGEAPDPTIRRLDLPVLPLGVALLDEGVDAFAGVVAEHVFGHHL